MLKLYFCAALIWIASNINPALAQLAEEIEDVVFNRLSSALLVDYLQTHDMLRADQGVSVRIFSDGRVEVNLPPIYSRAGTYEMTLSDTEVDDLVTEIIESNLQPTVAPSTGLTYISDSTRTHISLFASAFSTSSGVTTQLTGPVEIQESDLGMSATNNTRNRGGRRSRLRQVEQRLLDLTTDSRLRRI